MPIYKMDGKKDGLQKYRVRINFTNAQGKADSVERVAYGYEDAKEKEAKLLKDIKEAPLANKKIKVKEVSKDYLAWQVGKVRQSTINKREEHLRLHILPFLGEEYITFSSSKADEWQEYLKDKGLSVATMNKVRTTFKHMMNYAMTKKKLIAANPLEEVEPFKDPYEEVKEMQIYSVEEFQKFIAVAKQEAEKTSDTRLWDFYVFFNIAFLCGMRKSEIIALKWSDIYGDTIRIRRGIIQNYKGGDIEAPPKTKKSNRDIKIPKQLKKILDEHYARYKDAYMFSDEWRICGGLTPLRSSTITNRNNYYAEGAGVKKIRIHDFRHSHASYLIHKKVSIVEIARRLGHSTIKQTLDTYAHLYPADEKAALRHLNKIEI